MRTRAQTIATILAERIGDGNEDLVEEIEELVDRHRSYADDKSERETLRAAVRTLMRPRTNNIRALLDCPDEILNSIRAAAPARADLLELLPAPADTATPGTTTP